MNRDILTAFVCITLVICTTVIGGYMYNMNDRNNMAKNIDNAIAKGVDPISVKCAYITTSDSICIAYAMGKK
jgi:hypothetical protein